MSTESQSTDPHIAYREFATPCESHAVLGRKIGRWNLAVTFFQGPGVKAFESRGTSTYAWILGGRVLENLVVGAPEGQPYEGRGYSGFDTRNCVFWFDWFDSMGTGVMRGEGRAGADGKSLQWSSESTDIVARGIKRVRAVERSLTADEWMSEIYDLGPDGREFVRTHFHSTRA